MRSSIRRLMTADTDELSGQDSIGLPYQTQAILAASAGDAVFRRTG